MLRLLRARRDLHRWPLLAALVAAPASAVLLMVSDQSLAGMLEATRVRALIGGGQEWYEEYARYSTLLEPGSFQGAIGRRAAVLVAVLAAVGVLWALRRTRAGLATGPARRLVVGFLLMLAVMTLSPTKWTQHFGDVAGYGAAVLVLGFAAWSARAVRPRPRALVAGLAATAAVGSLVLAGYNLWPYAGNWFTPTFSTLPPQVAGVPLATVLAVAGAVLVARCSGGRRGGGPAARHESAPGARAGPGGRGAAGGVLVLQVGSFARIAYGHRDSYTLASDALATARGEPCGLQRLLSVETDPGAGLLPAEGGGPAAPRTLPVDVGGTLLPGTTVAGRLMTAWFTLDPAQRSGQLPVVVTTSGQTRPGDGLFLEFGADGRSLERRRVAAGDAGPTDHRELAPAGAAVVRLVVAPTGGASSPAVVSLPRVPRLTPHGAGAAARQHGDPGLAGGVPVPVRAPRGAARRHRAAARLAGRAAGRRPVRRHHLRAGFGGPFTASRLLVTQQRMATYLQGDPTRDGATLYRWVPRRARRAAADGHRADRDGLAPRRATGPGSGPGTRSASGRPAAHGCLVTTRRRDPNRRQDGARTMAVPNPHPRPEDVAPHVAHTGDHVGQTRGTDPRRCRERPSRLVVQRGLFFGPSAVVPEDLYSVVERGIARRERDRVTLSPGSKVSTNTYFGRFHATYWQRWTTVPEVEVTATVSGTGRIRLMASDTNKVWRIIAPRTSGGRGRPCGWSPRSTGSSTAAACGWS